MFLQQLNSSLSDGESSYQETSDLSSQVMEHTSIPGRDRIRQEMKVLQEELDSLKAIITDSRADLQSSIQDSEEFQTEHAQFSDWIAEAEDKVKCNTQHYNFAAPDQQEVEFEVQYFSFYIQVEISSATARWVYLF